MRNITANHLALVVVVHLDELAEPRAVVVPRGFRVAKSLQDRIGVENFRFDGTSGGRRVAEIAEQVLGRLRLASARLAAHDDRLRHLQHAHVADRLIGDGVNVRRQLSERSSIVFLDGRLRVEVLDLFVRVDRDQNVGYVCLGMRGLSLNLRRLNDFVATHVNLIFIISVFNVMQQCGFIQEHQLACEVKKMVRNVTRLPSQPLRFHT